MKFENVTSFLISQMLQWDEKLIILVSEHVTVPGVLTLKDPTGVLQDPRRN